MAIHYNRIMLGKAGCHADKCRAEGFVGVDFLSDVDLTASLCDDWHDFNREFIPVWLRSNPGKSKVAAGLACGNLWTVCRGLQADDVVLAPNGRESITWDGLSVITIINRANRWPTDAKWSGWNPPFAAVI